MCTSGCSTESKNQTTQSGCCCTGGSFQRRFISPEEEKKQLKDYSEQLKNELEGVEARLKELG